MILDNALGGVEEGAMGEGVLDKEMMALLATSRLDAEQLTRVVSRLDAEQLTRVVSQIDDVQLTRVVSRLDDLQLRRVVYWLNDVQLRRFVSHLDAGKIPVIQNLYSTIYADLKSEKRQLDQGTFGPDAAVAEESVCNTPMCVAGHTVNVAGPEGFALKDKFGFHVAALLIHRVSRPDVSAPRYDDYPDEWALAYIEARAAEEAA